MLLPTVFSTLFVSESGYACIGCNDIIFVFWVMLQARLFGYHILHGCRNSFLFFSPFPFVNFFSGASIVCQIVPEVSVKVWLYTPWLREMISAVFDFMGV